MNKLEKGIALVNDAFTELEATLEDKDDQISNLKQRISDLEEQLSHYIE